MCKNLISKIISIKTTCNAELLALENEYTDEFINMITKKLKLDPKQSKGLKLYLKNQYNRNIKNFKEV